MSESIVQLTRKGEEPEEILPELAPQLTTKINVSQLSLDILQNNPERLRNWEEQRRHPLLYMRNRWQWENYPKWRYVAPFPLHVDLEADSRCNLKCPMCYRRVFDNMRVNAKKDPNLKFAAMDYDLYKRAVDECIENELYSLSLSWRGESTLHPQLIDFVAYAKDAGIPEVSFITHGGNLTEEYIKGLIDARLDYISLSIDATAKAYDKLRAPLKYDETVERVALMHRLRDEYGEGYPKIKVQGIYNYFEGDILDYYNTFLPITDNVSFNVEHDYSVEHHHANKEEDNIFCPYPWQRITVTATGLVPLCIADWDADVPIGDIKTKTIKEIWHGPAMELARNMHLENRRMEIKPCAACIRLEDASIEDVAEPLREASQIYTQQQKRLNRKKDSRSPDKKRIDPRIP